MRTAHTQDLRVRVEVYDPNTDSVIYQANVKPSWGEFMSYWMPIPVIRPNGMMFRGIDIRVLER